MPTLRLSRLYCHRTSDGPGKDDIAIVGIDTPHIWKGKMSASSGHNDLGLVWGFDNILRLAIYEMDGGLFGNDDLLGAINLDQSHVGSGQHIFTFTGHGSHYELTWQVS